MQEVVRTALTALYEAASHQSERMAELELDLKQKANKEDVNAALAQKASSFDVSSRITKVLSEFTPLRLPSQLGLPAPSAFEIRFKCFNIPLCRCIRKLTQPNPEDVAATHLALSGLE